MITIKKYPNRRLYDTSTSQYVNLDYIHQLVMNHTEFEIVSSKDGSNLTKTVLLQIISESETNDNQSLLTDALLKQLIRFYDSDMQVFVRQYLEQSMARFLEQQESMQGMMKNLVDASPMNMFTKMMEQNAAMWQPKDKDK
ncbi:polyhydroxyalkanoate synthesis repressor PhaR [Psychrobium sp. MM17-31]|uniref:polyhydroxyalkanoate synthesis repressor PhaR n=1 Tax=Psychrobium sp. MM17-31 TaxID=2917758 RepID=UPI001EF6225D|nr:polyhydroxyalkanoate synthesis repressor PhaR [Psychrobium sp. MM17-31]MCG7530634.1 polyhydroxyalkanoate synthesis repressor PhaR [Psychrobium sp. MM17-31]